MKEAKLFESWINNLAEGTWSLPETPEQKTKLIELLSQELPVGPDATNATEQLYDLIGDDVLFDNLSELAKDANADARPVIIARMEELSSSPDVAEVLSQVQGEMQDQGVDQDQDINDIQADVEGDEELPQQIESLNAMRRAAGLAESIMVDESGNTWDHLLDRFKFEVRQFKDGGELEHNLYNALYDYYKDHGVMPYEAGRGKHADPVNWVSHRFAQDLGLDEGSLGVHEGSCNHTMEGEYCPEHGLAECGGTVAGSIAPMTEYTGNVTNFGLEESDAVARIKSLALGEAVMVNPSTTITNPNTEKMVNPDWEKGDVHDLQQAVVDKIKYSGGSVPPESQKSGLAAKSGDVIDVDAKEVAEDDIPDEFISAKSQGPSPNDVQRYADYTKDMKQNFGADWKPTPGVAKPYDTSKLGTPQATQAPVSVHEGDAVLARIKSLALLK